nr:unnamed protein product [Callosobruchus chinensis]
MHPRNFFFSLQGSFFINQAPNDTTARPAPTTLSIPDAVQRRAIRHIGNPALTCHLQPLSQWRAFGDLSRSEASNYG